MCGARANCVFCSGRHKPNRATTQTIHVFACLGGMLSWVEGTPDTMGLPDHHVAETHIAITTHGVAGARARLGRRCAWAYLLRTGTLLNSIQTLDSAIPPLGLSSAWRKVHSTARRGSHDFAMSLLWRRLLLFSCAAISRSSSVPRRSIMNTILFFDCTAHSILATGLIGLWSHPRPVL